MTPAGLAGLSLIVFALPAWADIYAFTDAKGIIHLSNTPEHKEARLVATSQGSAVIPASLQPLARPPERSRYAPLIDSVARVHQLDPALLHAIVTAESGYNPNAVSAKGAKGLMQLMPVTAQRYGVENILDPSQNLTGGARYLSDLLRMFDQNIELAVAAYNAGEQAVIRHGNTVPPYRETQAYVPRVLKLHKKYQSIL